jgi:uncharacterized peroxidase-related enzyme
VTFIKTVPESEATGDVAAFYAADREALGYVRNLTAAFSIAPEVLAAWQQLNGAIKARMDARRYELATLAAARQIRSSYCALAHGSVLLDEFVDEDGLQAIMADHHRGGLDPVDVAVMDLAEKVAADATSVGEDDFARLRKHGITDSEIFDVVAAAAARCFFSKTLDGLGVQPDAQYGEQLGGDVLAALTVGRKVASE